MRLTCPNCDAQYEVPDDVIPQDGRDVQCSNCGNTWFQPPADQAAAAPVESEDSPPETEWAPEVSDDEPLNHAEDERALAEPEVEAPVSMASDAPDEVLAAAVKAAIQRAQPEAQVNEAPVEPEETEEEDAPLMDEALIKEQEFEEELEAALSESTGLDTLFEDDTSDIAPQEDTQKDHPEDHEDALDDSVYFEPEGAPDEPPREIEAKRRTIDPTVASILQEEAALEAERRAEENTLESQPDLGLDKPAEEPLDDAAKRAKQARERMARMRGLSPDAADRPAEPIPANSRRDLLPDIDEINSTLRATEDRAPDEQPDGRPTASQRRAGGSRIGFAMAFLLIGLFAYIYNRPDVVADTVPGSENYVAAYVNFVDQARLGLDAQMTKLMLWIDGMSSEG